MFPCPSSLLEFAQTHVHWVSDAIQPSHLRSHHSYPASIFPSIRVFSSELALCIRWPKYWSCSFSISPSNEYSGLISFRIEWFDLLAVQGTLKGLLQQHSLKASILQCSAFLMVQLSHHRMIARKTIALTILFDYDFSHLGRWGNQFQIPISKVLCSWNHFWDYSLYLLEFKEEFRAIISVVR